MYHYSSDISQHSSFSDIARWVITQIQKNGKNRERILNDLRGVFKEKMIDIPANINIVIHENTENLFHLVIPRKIASGEELSDFELKQVAGGTSSSTTGVLWADANESTWFS